MMHFSMQTYSQASKLAGLSRYGICEGSCWDQVPFGAMTGLILMRRLEEAGWGGKVTWSSLWKSGVDWLLEEVDTATVLQ